MAHETCCFNNMDEYDANQSDGENLDDPTCEKFDTANLNFDELEEESKKNPWEICREKVFKFSRDMMTRCGLLLDEIDLITLWQLMNEKEKLLLFELSKSRNKNGNGNGNGKQCKNGMNGNGKNGRESKKEESARKERMRELCKMSKVTKPKRTRNNCKPKRKAKKNENKYKSMMMSSC